MFVASAILLQHGLQLLAGHPGLFPRPIVLVGGAILVVQGIRLPEAATLPNLLIDFTDPDFRPTSPIQAALVHGGSYRLNYAAPCGDPLGR